MQRCRSLIVLSSWCLIVMWVACGQPPKQKGELCDQNADCASGLKCLGGICGDGQTGSACSKDTDCRQGFLCAAKQCRQSGTSPESTPDAGETPRDTASQDQREAGAEPIIPDTPVDTPPEQRPENRGEPQPETTPEIPTETILAANCRSHSECTNGQMCLLTKDRLTAQCSPKPTSCQSNDDCAAMQGTHCRLVALPTGNQVETLCVYPFDDTKTPKKIGEVCAENNDCESGVCLSSSVCGGFCKEDKDCQSQAQFYCGTYTYFQRGEFGGCYPRCKNEADCPDGYLCDSQSKCTPKEAQQVGSACRSKADCPASGECLNNWNHGYCLIACTPTKQLCGAAGMPACPTDHECRTDVDDTTQKRCVPLCAKDTVCALFGGGQGYCLRTCQSDKECRKDYYCAAINDANAMACLPRGTTKPGELCEANGDCESGVCRLFPSGRYCAQQCDTTVCPNGYSCNSFGTEKLCEKSCVKDSNCPEGYQCIAQQCVIPPNTTDRDIGESCTQHSQCKHGTCINNAGLFPHGYCTQACGAQACPAGSICINYGGTTGSLCTRSCQADASCGRKDIFCFSVRVNGGSSGPIPCSTAQPCPPNADFPVTCQAELDGSFCATGICLGRGVRPTGQSCTSGFQCQSGYCYLQVPASGTRACNNHSECIPAAPICHPTQKVCVLCSSNADCSPGLSCINQRCTTGGYCADSCANGTPCSQNTSTKCTALFNKNADKVGDYCLPECRSSLQCQADFVCKVAQSEKVCSLP